MVCTTNVCATIVPVAVKLPVMVCDPSNRFDPVVAKDPVRASFEEILPTNDPEAATKADEVASAAVTLVESEPDVETYSDDVNSVFVMRDDNEAENADTSVGNPATEPENDPVIPCVACIVPVTESEPDTVGLY
jgi:hypothetical protein